MAIKDLVPVEGVRFTMGSRAFADQVATYSDYSVQQLESRGAIVGGVRSPRPMKLSRFLALNAGG